MKFRCEIMRLTMMTKLGSSNKIDCRVHIVHRRVCYSHSLSSVLSHREISHYFSSAPSAHISRSCKFNVIVVKIANATTKKATPMWKFYRAEDNNNNIVLYVFTIIKCFVYNLLFCYRANHRDCVACMLFFSIMLSRPLFAVEHIFI